MNEQELLLDCLMRLNACGVPYLLTGSMASNYWGVPRTTHDLDFVLALERSGVLALVRAFEGDFFIQESSVEAALRPPFQCNAIDGRSGLKVDFWVLRSDAFEQESFARRQQITLLGIQTWIASPEDVILHKLLWETKSPSERQLQDVAGVWSLQRDQLDLAYLRRWAQQLGLEPKLDQVVKGEIQPKQT